MCKWSCIAAVFLSAGLVACSSNPPRTRLDEIEVIADTKANGGMIATALDLVFVYDSATASLLPKSGPDWFDRRTALKVSLATNIDVINVELPPATVYKVAMPERASKAIGVYCYVNYLAASGQVMGNLTPYRKMTIRLAPDTVIYTGS